MPIALAIVSALMSARQMKQSDDKLGSAFNVLSSAYGAFNSNNMFRAKPTYSNVMSDSGVRRNYL